MGVADTVTKVTTLQREADFGTLGRLEPVLAKLALGTILSPRKITVAGAAAAVSFDLTSATLTFPFITASTGVSDAETAASKLRPALVVSTLRVTAGTFPGARIVTDVGGTPLSGDAAGPGVATISDDGKTITFEAGAAVTAFIIEYVPRAATDPSTKFDDNP
jgi:hypothetical protein